MHIQSRNLIDTIKWINNQILFKIVRNNHHIVWIRIRDLKQSISILINGKKNVRARANHHYARAVTLLDKGINTAENHEMGKEDAIIGALVLLNCDDVGYRPLLDYATADSPQTSSIGSYNSHETVSPIGTKEHVPPNWC